MAYFDIIGKTERQSAGSTASGAPNAIPPHDSGYSEKGSNARPDSSATARNPGHQRTASMGRGSGAMVYGIVQYDFNAERPDELEAKAGEAIIVIAQSNPEWFVAKPIGRLGGPGLIPVSFIEIRDMTTGYAVQDVQSVVARAGVPKVEEWKRMVADYKNSSITLGKFEGGGGIGSLRDGERMSPDGGRLPTSSNGNGSYVSREPSSTDNSDLISTGSKPGLQSTKWQSNAPGWPQPRITAHFLGTDFGFDPSLLLRKR